MQDSGWIKLHRSIMDHWLWQDKPFSKGQAMIDLILCGNYKDQKILVDGSLRNIERGNIITSVRKLCDRWGWSNTKVRRFLKMLENDGMITVKSDSKKTVINVVNYSVYQGFDYEKTTQKRQRSDTKTSQKHTNKKVKKVKNNNKYNNIRACACMPPTYEQVSRYCEQRKNHIDAKRFVDYYESRDWMMGNAKMKNWKAAVRYWERSGGNNTGNVKSVVERLDCERDYDFRLLEKQLFDKQMTG